MLPGNRPDCPTCDWASCRWTARSASLCRTGSRSNDSTTVVEIFSGEVIFTLKSTTYCGGVLDQLWHDAVTGRDLDQVLADAIASLR